VIVGGGRVTVYEPELVAVPPGVATEIGPVVAPLGRWAVLVDPAIDTDCASSLPAKERVVKRVPDGIAGPRANGVKAFGAA
jgi:hypothetical protein